jgi:hypothetical protein
MSPGKGLHSGWTFTVDRLSGDAVLETFDDYIMGQKKGASRIVARQPTERFSATRPGWPGRGTFFERKLNYETDI